MQGMQQHISQFSAGTKTEASSSLALYMASLFGAFLLL
jgi:hypothetical protein